LRPGKKATGAVDLVAILLNRLRAVACSINGTSSRHFRLVAGRYMQGAYAALSGPEGTVATAGHKNDNKCVLQEFEFASLQHWSRLVSE
jgi:hypothetical protein